MIKEIAEECQITEKQAFSAVVVMACIVIGTVITISAIIYKCML